VSPLPADPVGRSLVQMMARDRYERWLNTEIVALLERGFREIAATLVTDFADLTPYQQTRRLRLFGVVARELRKSYSDANKFMQGQMRDFVAIESRAHIEQVRSLVARSDIAEATLSNLTSAEVKAIAEFPIAGLGIGEWFEKQATDMNAATRGAIQLGLLNGESPQQIVGRIIPATENTTAVVRRARANLQSLIRTTTTTVQTQAAYESMASIGPELVPAYRYVAVRDGRTTPVCMALDGRVFRFDDPKAKRPPQHINCRSTIVAEPDFEALGIPRPNTVEGGYTMGSYTGWLRAQPSATQDAILGETGAKLFRDERATLAQLVTDDGRRMTISALRSLYGSAA
jgi:SPP1 gp7 family putative phage head morphogenesis protein